MITQDLEMVEVWLKQPWPTGVMVAGGCSADGQPFARSIGAARPLELSDDFWLIINEAVAQLDAYGCGKDRAIWVFETGVMHVVVRTDGAWAGALSAREVSLTVQQGMQARLMEFVSMGG